MIKKRGNDRWEYKGILFTDEISALKAQVADEKELKLVYLCAGIALGGIVANLTWAIML